MQSYQFLKKSTIIGNRIRSENKKNNIDGKDSKGK